MRDIPAYLLLGIYIVYLIINPAPTLFWPIFFLIGLLYAVFTLDYWKKHQEGFNVYVSLGLLVVSLAFFGFTLSEYLLRLIFSS